MIILGLAFLGALTGAFTARKRGGNGLDIAQYAAGYAIAFALVGLIVTIFVHRSMV